MPYPNEHAARMSDPKQFTEFARRKLEKGVGVIYGIREDRTSEIQSYRFKSDDFTPAEAETWLSDHNIEPEAFEPAEEKPDDVEPEGDMPAAEVMGPTIEMADASERTRWHLVLREGATIHHPGLKAPLKVTPDLLKTIAESHGRFTESGYKLPALKEHETRDGRFGHVEAVEYKPGRGLYAQIRWNEDSWEMIQSEKISHLSPNLAFGAEDDRGNKYRALLREVSAVAAPHLKDLPTIREGSEALAAAEAAKPGEEDMDKETKEMLLQLAERFDRFEAAHKPKDPPPESEEVVKLKETIEMFSKERTEFLMAEATGAVESLIASDKLLPAGQDAWTQLYIDDKPRFLALSEGLKPLGLRGEKGYTRPADDDGDENPFVRVAARTASIQASQKIGYDEAHSLAMAEVLASNGGAK